MATALDTRPAEQFHSAHLPNSANIPLQELAARVHELPAAGVPILLYDDDPLRRAAAAAFLERRGHRVDRLAAAPGDLTVSGPSVARLWQPNVFLVECLERIGPPVGAPTAIDVACGTGRDAVYLALTGYDVTAIDHLPDALERTTAMARNHGVSIRPMVHDLERDATLPIGPPADLVCVFRYLHRPLFRALRQAVRSGGHIVYETFHVRNLETGRSPRSPHHLLRTGELAEAFARFDVLFSADAVERDGRYFSHLLARRVD